MTNTADNVTEPFSMVTDYGPAGCEVVFLPNVSANGVANKTLYYGCNFDNPIFTGMVQPYWWSSDRLDFSPAGDNSTYLYHLATTGGTRNFIGSAGVIVNGNAISAFSGQSVMQFQGNAGGDYSDQLTSIIVNKSTPLFSRMLIENTGGNGGTWMYIVDIYFKSNFYDIYQATGDTSNDPDQGFCFDSETPSFNGYGKLADNYLLYANSTNKWNLFFMPNVTTNFANNYIAANDVCAMYYTAPWRTRIYLTDPTANGITEYYKMMNPIVSTIGSEQNVSAGVTANPQLNITFLTKTPSDLTTSNVFGQPQVQFNYFVQYSNGTVGLRYKVNGTWDGNEETINQTGYPSLYASITSQSVSNNTATNWTILVDDDDVYPGDFNLPHDTFEDNGHKAYALNGNNVEIKQNILNVSNKTRYNILEVMANASPTATSLRVYYCNSTYSTGQLGSTSNCVNFYNWLGPTYNHTHTVNSSHIVVPFSIQNGELNGVKVTANSSFVFRGRAGGNAWNAWYLAGAQARVGSYLRVSTNDNTWADLNGTLDMHIHQFNGTEAFWFQGYAGNLSNVQIYGIERTDTLNETYVKPTAPTPITSPVSGGTYVIGTPMNINYSSSYSPIGYNIVKYNVTLINAGTNTYNRTIVADNYLNLSTTWTPDVAGYNISGVGGQFRICVWVWDNTSFEFADSPPFDIHMTLAFAMSSSYPPFYNGNYTWLNTSWSGYDANGFNNATVELNGVNYSASRNGDTSYYYALLPVGNYTWKMYANDSTGYQGVTAQQNFIILQPTVLFSYNNSSTPITYSSTTVSWFTLVWNTLASLWSNLLGIAQVKIEGNWSGIATNYTMTKFYVIPSSSIGWVNGTKDFSYDGQQPNGNVSSASYLGGWPSTSYSFYTVNSTNITLVINYTADRYVNAAVYCYDSSLGVVTLNVNLGATATTFYLPVPEKCIVNNNNVTILYQGNGASSYLWLYNEYITYDSYNYSTVLPAGTFYWKSYANNTNGDWNVSDTWNFTINQASNKAMMFLKNNTAAYQDQNMKAWVGEQTNVTASITIGTVSLQRNGTNITGASDVSRLSAGVYNYTLSSAGNQNYSGNSTTFYLTVDNAPISWSGNASSIPSIYDPTNASVFNITWTPAAGVTIDSRQIEGNWSGSAVNYTLPVSGTYSDILPAGPFYWKSFANNTYNEQNASDKWEFTINKAAPICTLTTSSNITYGTASTVNCSCVNAPTSAQLYRNATLLASNSVSEILPVGTWLYDCNVSSNANYSAASSATGVLNIQQAPNLMAITINNGTAYVNKDVMTKYGISMTVSATNATGSADLFRNNTAVTQPVTEQLGVGVYNYTANVSSSQNYTANSTSSVLTIIQSPTNLALYLNGAANNITSVVNTTVNVTASSSFSSPITLWRNGTNYSINATPFYNVSEYDGLASFTFNITVSQDGNANYTTPSPVSYWITLVNASVYVPPTSPSGSTGGGGGSTTSICGDGACDSSENCSLDCGFVSFHPLNVSMAGRPGMYAACGLSTNKCVMHFTNPRGYKMDVSLKVVSNYDGSSAWLYFPQAGTSNATSILLTIDGAKFNNATNVTDSGDFDLDLAAMIPEGTQLGDYQMLIGYTSTGVSGTIPVTITVTNEIVRIVNLDRAISDFLSTTFFTFRKEMPIIGISLEGAELLGILIFVCGGILFIAVVRRLWRKGK